MNFWVKLALTAISGIAGVIIARKIKMPVPFMIGSMVGVAVFNILTGEAYMPKEMKVFTQSISGAYIGLSLSRRDLRNMRELLAPTLVLIVCFLGFTAIMGFINYYLFHLDAATSFLVAIPGGVTEISLMASEVGADPAIVSFLQTFRLFSVYLFFPSIITFMSKRVEMEETEALSNTDEVIKDSFIDRIVPDNRTVRQLIVAVIGLIGGYLGKLSGLPAGTLSFAMILVILVHINSNKLFLERKYKQYVQVLAGMLIGVSISMDTVRNIGKIILPTIVLILAYIIANFIISYLMAKTGKIDRISAMFASSPGGASDMALVASEIGGDSPKIAVIQIIRLVSCYIIFPIWSKFLIGLIE